MKIKSYNELLSYPTFLERFRYLSIPSKIGIATFGYDRYLNQRLYRSKEWKAIRNFVIIRDEGCDLGIIDRPIPDYLVVHHMNPITIDDIENHEDYIFNPDYLITTTKLTHQAIHFSNESLLPKPVIERRSGDTQLWVSIRNKSK